MLPYYQFTVYHIGPVTLQVWGTLVAIGLAVALFLGFYESKRRGLDPDYFLSMSLWAIVAALFFSRVFYVALFWNDYSHNLPAVFKVWNGGMVAYGGVFGAMFALYCYSRMRKINFIRYLDVVALVFPAGYAIGRIGCHLIRDHMGKITHVPWGFLVAPGIARHDTAIYSILVGLVLFLIFWPLRKRTFQPGTLTVLIAFFYAGTRFIIDNFRAEDIVGSDPRFFGLTISQYISAIAFIACGFFLLRRFLSSKTQKMA